jgi:ankyrin repeat protein
MGRTALHIACDLGDLDLVIFLAKRQEIFLDVEDEDRNTPLHLAVQAGHFEVIKYLIE